MAPAAPALARSGGLWECGRWTSNASNCCKNGLRQGSGRIIILGSMHLLGCYGCSVMVPQIDKIGWRASALDAYECVHPEVVLSNLQYRERLILCKKGKRKEKRCCKEVLSKKEVRHFRDLVLRLAAASQTNQKLGNSSWKGQCPRLPNPLPILQKGLRRPVEIRSCARFFLLDKKACVHWGCS